MRWSVCCGSRCSAALLDMVPAAASVTAPTVERLRKQDPSARIVVLSDRCELTDALASFARCLGIYKNRMGPMVKLIGDD